MAGIDEKNNCANLGGIRKIQLISLENIISLGKPRAGIISDIELDSKRNKFNVAFFTKTAQHRENDKRGEQGKIYRQRLTFTMRGNPLELRNWIEKYSEHWFLAVYKDSNGASKLIGNLENPLTFSTDYDSKKKPTDPSETDFEFTCETLLPCPHVDANFLASITRIFDKTFNPTFN